MKILIRLKSQISGKTEGTCCYATSHNEPQQAIMSHNEPKKLRRATTTHSDPQGTTTIHSEPQLKNKVNEAHKKSNSLVGVFYPLNTLTARDFDGNSFDIGA